MELQGIGICIEPRGNESLFASSGTLEKSFPYQPKENHRKNEPQTEFQEAGEQEFPRRRDFRGLPCSESGFPMRETGMAGPCGSAHAQPPFGALPKAKSVRSSDWGFPSR